MGERRLGLVAAGVAFFSMLAVFPALAALIALVGFWFDPGAVQGLLEMAEDFLPPEALEILSEQTATLILGNDSGLGWASLFSLAAAAWSARLGVGALAQGINAIHGGRARGGLHDYLQALLLTMVLMGVGVIAVAAILFTPLVLAVLSFFLPQDSWLPLLAELIRWAVALTALVAGLGLFYRYGPNREGGRRIGFLSPGLYLAIILWASASIAFTLFLNNFGNYNEIYGSIGAVVALLMWFYISAYAVLLGGALNHAIEWHRFAPQSADADGSGQSHTG